MNKQETKKVTAEIDKETWKALKVLAVQKECALCAVVAEVLQNSMKKKVKTFSNSEET